MKVKITIFLLIAVWISIFDAIAQTGSMVNSLGVSMGWYSDDTRSADGTVLNGTSTSFQPYFNYPGAPMPTVANDLAIALQIKFGDFYAGSSGGVMVLDGTTANLGKSSVRFYGAGTGIGTLNSSFTSSFRWYMEPYPTTRTLALNLLVVGTDNLTYSLSWLGSGSVMNAWNEFSVDANTAPVNDNGWRVYNNGAPGSAAGAAKSLNDWFADPTYGSILSGATVIGQGFNIGSWQRQCRVGVDWLESSLLNGGNRIDFVAPVHNVTQNTFYNTIQAAITAANPGDAIQLAAGTYEFTAQMNLDKDGLSITGLGNVIFQANNASWSTVNGYKHLIGMYAGDVANPITISNVTMNCNSQCFGLNAYGNAYVVFDNVAINGGKGAGLTVNGSTVIATNLNTATNAWGAVNVDPGSGVTTPSVFTLNSGTLAENTQIWSDGNYATGPATVTVNAAGYNKYNVGTTKIWTNRALANCATITKGGETTIYATIQAAIDAAAAGDVIDVAVGTYIENINVNKRVSIIGAGSGETGGSILTKSPGDTKIGVIQLNASGLSAVEPILIKDMRIQPVGMAGISVGRFTETTGTNVEYLKFDNVYVIGTNTNPSTEQERGFYVDNTSSANNLVFEDCAFNNLTYGWYLQKQVSADVSTVSNVAITNSLFNHNNHKGLYAEKLSSATFTNCTFDHNGMDASVLPSYFAPWSAGMDVNLKAGTYTGITVDGCTITNNGIGGAKEGVGLALKGRDDGATYGPFPGILSNVTVQNCTITSNERGIRIGEPGKNAAQPTNVVISNNTINNNRKHYTGTDGTDYGDVVNMLSVPVTLNSESVLAGQNVWYVNAGESISAVVTAALAGDIVNVNPGTFSETVTVNKSIQLKGLNGAIIQAPASLPAASDPLSSIVIVTGSGVNAEITGFTIQGPGPTNCGSMGRGIFVRDGANANIHHNQILNIRDNIFSGCQNGIAVQIGRNAFSTSGSATITNNVITGYQKGGIVVDNTGSSAIISDNVIAGAGTTDVTAQNGIQVSRGATATLSGNTVSGNSYHNATNPSDWGACGILLYQSGAVSLTGGNNLTGNDNNYYAYGGITGTLALGAEVFGTSTAPVTKGYQIGLSDNVNLDASLCTFDGISPASASLSELYTIEDRIWHSVDDPSKTGFVKIKTGNLYATHTETDAKIQYAVTAAVNGDVINVSAGTYEETSISLNKAITLNGPNAGLAGNNVSRTAEARIFNTSISVTAAAIIDGFEVYQTNNTADAILVQSAATIKNSVIRREGVSTGIVARGITTAVSTSGFAIQNNLFTGSTSGGLFSGHKTWNSGLWINGGSGSVTSNVFENCRTAINADDFNAGISISGNTFQNSGTFIAFGGTTPTNGQFVLGANDFKTLVSTFINLSNVNTAFRLDITSSTYNGAAFNTLPLATLYQIEACMYHQGLRNGLVTYVADNLFVNTSKTIQNAISYANAGNTVNVAPGSFTEDLLLNKTVTIKGANAGIAAGNNAGTRVTETELTGGFRITSPGTIDGFTIKNGRTSGSFKVGIAVAVSGATVKNSIIRDVLTPAQSDGLSTETGINSLTLLNNTITNNWRGIYLNAGSGHVFTDNLIDANNGVGVGIGSDGLSNFTMTGNTISNHTLEGWGASAVGASVIAHNNLLLNNGTSVAHYGGLEIDATLNYWGSCPVYSGNVTVFPYYSTYEGTPPVLGNLINNITASATSPTICAGSSTTILGTGGSEYLWDNGLGLGASKVVSPAATTTYNVTAKDANLCNGAFGSVTVTVIDAPTVTISGPSVVSLGGSVTLTASGATTYAWSNGATTAAITVSPTSATTYSVTGTTGTCSGTATHAVTVASVDAGANQFICNGGSATLTVTCNGFTPTSYLWTPGDEETASVTVSPTVTTTYTVTVDGTMTDQVTVFVRPKPVANAGPNITIASGGSGTLTGSASTGTAPYSYSWTGPSGFISAAQSPTVNEAGAYTLVVTDAYGCTSVADQAVVTVAASGYTVSGNVSYYNTLNPQMHNVTVSLKQGGTTIYSAVTPATGNGNFQILGVADGTYDVHFSLPTAWGGVTSTDIVAIQNHYKPVNPTPLVGLKRLAADVVITGSGYSGTDAFVNLADRNKVNAKRLNPNGVSFETGNWVFVKEADVLANTTPLVYANSAGTSSITITVGGGAVTQNFKSLCYGDVDASYSGYKDEENVVNLAEGNGLELSNFPNPFNRTTTIRYTVPVESKVTITIHDLLGNKIATIADPDNYEGIHDMPFNANGLAPGVYLYTVRLDTGDDQLVQTGKMIINR